MRSDGAARVPAGREPGAVRRLLDMAFGFSVWAAHFLAVYVATSLACVLGLSAASAAARSTFRVALVLLTVAAAAVVAGHAVRAYRRRTDEPDRRFSSEITMGNDALASFGILWQLFPILLVPPCT